MQGSVWLIIQATNEHLSGGHRDTLFFFSDDVRGRKAGRVKHHKLQGNTMVTKALYYWYWIAKSDYMVKNWATTQAH